MQPTRFCDMLSSYDIDYDTFRTSIGPCHHPRTRLDGACARRATYLNIRAWETDLGQRYVQNALVGARLDLGWGLPQSSRDSVYSLIPNESAVHSAGCAASDTCIRSELHRPLQCRPHSNNFKP
jgi:hypothetical protein